MFNLTYDQPSEIKKEEEKIMLEKTIYKYIVRSSHNRWGYRHTFKGALECVEEKGDGDIYILVDPETGKPKEKGK